MTHPSSNSVERDSETTASPLLGTDTTGVQRAAIAAQLRSDIEYLYQADAHSDEGPLGEAAARSILTIALRLAPVANAHAPMLAALKEADSVFDALADSGYLNNYRRQVWARICAAISLATGGQS